MARAGLDSKTRLNIMASNPRRRASRSECSTSARPTPVPRYDADTKYPALAMWAARPTKFGLMYDAPIRYPPKRATDTAAAGRIQ